MPHVEGQGPKNLFAWDPMMLTAMGAGTAVGFAGGLIATGFMTKSGRISAVTRLASAIKVKPGMASKYKALHSKPPIEFINLINKHHFRNYTVHHHTSPCGGDFFFTHTEYIGGDLEDDYTQVFGSKVCKIFKRQTEPLESPFKWHGRLPSQGGFGDMPGDEWPSPMVELHHDKQTPTEYAPCRF